MIMHSYYTSGLNLVTDVKNVQSLHGENINDDFSRTLKNHPGERGQEMHVLTLKKMFVKSGVTENLNQMQDWTACV